MLQMEVEYGADVSVINVIALNAGKFDAWLLLKTVMTNSDLLQKVPIMRGNKILLLQLSKKLRFLDAINYIPQGLASYKKSFNLKVSKTIFPHKWFSKLIFLANFVPFPPFSAFEGGLTMQEYDNLKKKYCNEDGIFSVHQMLIDYCQMDVKVLKMGFSRYCQSIFERFSVHPLDGTITLSSLAFKIFKTHYLADSDIYALDSLDLLANNSKLQYEILYYVKTLLDGTKYELITQREKLSQVNVNVNGKNFAVDGLLTRGKEIIAAIEIFGCHVHTHLLNDNQPCHLNKTGYSENTG